MRTAVDEIGPRSPAVRLGATELSAAGATQASARGVLNTALWLYRRWLEDRLGGGTALKDRHGFVSHPHVFLDDQVLCLPTPRPGRDQAVTGPRSGRHRPQCVDNAP